MRSSGPDLASVSLTGIVAGNSREPAISAVLPALLALVTALCGYAFTVEGM